MPLFTYKVIDKDGHVTQREGFFDAAENLQRHVKSLKETLLSHKQISTGRISKLSKSEALQLLQTLSTLLSAGLSLLTTLESMTRGEGSSKLKRATRIIMQSLNEGHNLAETLQNLHIYPLYIIDLIRLGLNTSKLPESLTKAQLLFHGEIERGKDLRKSMLYPVILLCIMTSMIVLFTQFLLPQISSYLHELGIQDFPVVTQSLIWTSDFLQNYSILLLCIVAILVALIIGFQRITWLQNKLTPLILKMPSIGRFYRRKQQNQWLFYISHLYASGMDFKSALDFTARSFQNQCIHNLLTKAHNTIYKGSSLLETLSQTELFSTVTLSLIQAGAQTGDIAGACGKAYAIEETAQKQTQAMFLKILEPALLIAMGLMLLWIVLAVITPIYDHLVV